MTPLDSPEEEKSEEPPKGFFEYWLSPVGNFLMGGAMIGIGAFLSFYTALVGVAFLIIGLARLFWEGFTARDRRSKR